MLAPRPANGGEREGPVCGLTGLTLLMALRIYDPDALLTTLSLWHKSGGRSGTWERVPAAGGDRGELEA